MASLRKWLVAASVILMAIAVGLVFVNRKPIDFVISDTAADIWPDPLGRQGVYLRDIGLAIQKYSQSSGHLPDSLSGIVDAPSLERSGESSLIDIWYTPVQYGIVGTSFELRSAGPDRTFATQDDVVHSDTAFAAQ